jgi:hypothetical protein
VKASFGWLTLLLVSGIAVAADRPLQRVYVHPQTVSVDAKAGGVLLGMCLDKGVIGAPRDRDPIAHWSHPRDVLVVKRTRVADNPFNPRLGPPVETSLEDVLKTPAEEREVEFVGAVDTSDGVNLRAKLTAKADKGCAYAVVVKQAVAAARKEEGMPAEVVRWVEESRVPLADTEKLLADVRKLLPGSPFAHLLRGYMQEKVYWPLGKSGETADGVAAVRAFAAEVGAVVAAVPEERRAAVARLVYGDTDDEPVGRLVARFGAQVPDTRMTAELRKALDVARPYLAGYAHGDARLYATARAPKAAADLPHLVIARKFAALMHTREGDNLPLGNGEPWAYAEALRVLAVTPAVVSLNAGKAEVTHPLLTGAKLSPAAYAGRLAAAGEHLNKPGVLDAAIRRVVELGDVVADLPSNDEAVSALSALLVSAGWHLYGARGDSEWAVAGLTGAAAALDRLTDIDVERPDHQGRAAVALVALPEAIKRAGLEVPADLKPFAAGPDVPADWLLALAGARSFTANRSAQDGEPLLLDVSNLSADEWRAFARDALPVLDRRSGGVQLLRSTDTATVERAASLRFAQQITVLAHDGLKSVGSVKVNGQAFPVGEICHEVMTRVQQAFDDAADPTQHTGRLRFKFAQAESGEGLLKEWADAAEAGEFAGQVVVLTLCPAEVSGKKVDRLVADLLDPKKGKAAAVVVPTDAADVRHFALAAVQASTAQGLQTHTPREVLDKGFETNLYALTRGRAADDRMTEVERWFPWSNELLVDFVLEVVKDEKKLAEFAAEHQKHRRRMVVLP